MACKKSSSVGETGWGKRGQSDKLWSRKWWLFLESVLEERRLELRLRTRRSSARFFGFSHFNVHGSVWCVRLAIMWLKASDSAWQWRQTLGGARRGVWLFWNNTRSLETDPSRWNLENKQKAQWPLLAVVSQLWTATNSAVTVMVGFKRTRETVEKLEPLRNLFFSSLFVDGSSSSSSSCFLRWSLPPASMRHCSSSHLLKKNTHTLTCFHRHIHVAACRKDTQKEQYRNHNTKPHLHQRGQFRMSD